MDVSAARIDTLASKPDDNTPTRVFATPATRDSVHNLDTLAAQMVSGRRVALCHPVQKPSDYRTVAPYVDNPTLKTREPHTRGDAAVDSDSSG